MPKFIKVKWQFYSGSLRRELSNPTGGVDVGLELAGWAGVDLCDICQSAEDIEFRPIRFSRSGIIAISAYPLRYTHVQLVQLSDHP